MGQSHMVHYVDPLTIIDCVITHDNLDPSYDNFDQNLTFVCSKL